MSQYVTFNYGETWLRKIARDHKRGGALGLRGEQNTHDMKVGGVGLVVVKMRMGKEQERRELG